MPSTRAGAQPRRARRPGRGCGGVREVGGRLAVEAQVAGGVFDHAVGLGGHHVQVLVEAHVEGLAAAPQRELDPVGGLGDVGGDGHRAVEATHRLAERVDRLDRRRRADGRRGWG